MAKSSFTLYYHTIGEPERCRGVYPCLIMKQFQRDIKGDILGYFISEHQNKPRSFKNSSANTKSTMLRVILVLFFTAMPEPK